MVFSPEHKAAGWAERKAKAGARPLTQGRLAGRFARAPHIWKSRLSWRIAIAIFLTILTVQILIMNVTIKEFKAEKLQELAEASRMAIVPLLEETTPHPAASPMDHDEARRLTTATRVNGVAIYGHSDLNLLAQFGAPVGLRLAAADNLPESIHSADGRIYETVYHPHELGRPYYIVVQLNASHVNGLVKSYIEYNAILMLVMSGFVTTVLMIALSHWLLGPILFLRGNLQRASENPEDPELTPWPFDVSDDIGSSIDIATKLIEQNAVNIKRIRSTAEDQIHKLAYYDTLTALPNRTLFLQTLGEQARRAAPDGDAAHFAVVAMDLDHFKDINDSMGHNVGDALLRGIAKRLRASLPETAIIARSGEDEFAITMPLTRGGISARDIGERVLGVVRAEPFRVFNESFQISASIGVATYPDDGHDPDQVLKNADIALNRAKEDGRDRICEYSEDFDRAVQQRFQMLRALRDAMEHDQLFLHYQPQFDLNTGRIIGAEALLRWWRTDLSRPEGGYFVPPADFVPIAEQSGLIVPIGLQVLKQACAAAAGWAKEGHEIRIAVNMSGAQFFQRDLAEQVASILGDSGIRASQLELEITESVFMEDINHAVEVLHDLHALGVELAIDDFGTGYSSLSYLRQFPIDRLKIDQSFIRNALNNPDDAAIARTIVRLGHSLNLRVIAEGVEMKEHEEFLRNEGCDEVQGYRYARPIPLEEFSLFLSSYNGDMSVFDR